MNGYWSWKSNFTKWQIFFVPHFLRVIKLVNGIHVLRWWFFCVLRCFYCKLLEIVFHSWHVGGAVLLKVNLHAWRKSSFLGTCQKNLLPPQNSWTSFTLKCQEFLNVFTQRSFSSKCIDFWYRNWTSVKGNCFTVIKENWWKIGSL